jgi:hypothetical protein
MDLTERAGRVVRDVLLSITGGVVLLILYVLLVPLAARLIGWLFPSFQYDGILMAPLVWPAVLYDRIFPPAPLPPNLMSGSEFPRLEAIIVMIVGNILQYAILTYALLQLWKRRRRSRANNAAIG